MNKIDFLNCCHSSHIFSVQLYGGLDFIIKHICCWGMVVHTINPKMGEAKEADLPEFKANLVYLESTGQPELGSGTLSLKKKNLLMCYEAKHF